MDFMNNATNILDLANGITGLSGTDFLLGYLTLFGFFIIFLILGFKYDLNEVIIVDSFITSILTVLFYIAGLVPIGTIAYPIIILFMGLIVYLFSQKN